MTVLVQARPGEAREEWLREAPREWTTRLREISPITDKTSHLRFRWRRNLEEEGEGQWSIYECVPAQLLDAGRVEQLSVHWSTLPKAEQMGRKRFVTEYQFYMFQTHRVDVSLFWILQGTKHLTGGTPFSYTQRERRVLEASNEDVNPVPPGLLPNIPFDERVVRAIQARDRLIKAGMNLDAMEKQNRPDALRAEDEAIEREFRTAFLDWHHTENAACASFMSWFARRKEAVGLLPEGPKRETPSASDFRDTFINSGVALGATAPRSRALQIAVR